MFNSNVFDYVNVLSKAADATWLRNEVLANNLSNVNTPGYKRQDVDFETTLRHALGNFKYKSVDARVSAIKTGELRARLYTDAAGYSYRVDGNNVDIDTEEVELAANQVKYNGLIDSINQEFANLRSVMS